MTLPVWHKQPNETGTQYSAFTCYLGIEGKRSIRAAFEVYKDIGNSVATASKQRKKRRVHGYFSKWASEYRWKERAEAYDAWLQGKQEQVISTHIEERRTLYRETAIDVLQAIRARVSDKSVAVKDLRELLELLDTEFLSEVRSESEINNLVALQQRLTL